MSQVYNPESDLIAEIERLKLSAREMRRKIERALNTEDRRVMNRLLVELRDRIAYLERKVGAP